MSRQENIRTASPADLPRLREIIRTSYEKYLERMDTPPAPMLEDLLPWIERGQLWVIGDPPVALVSLDLSQKGLEVHTLAVDPAHQGLGYSSRLMTMAETLAGDLGATRLWLYTNEVMVENLEIYRHMGFVEMSRTTDQGYRRVFMEKLL